MPADLMTAVTLEVFRDTSPRQVGAFAQGLEASGVVDYYQFWDQLGYLFPKSLWKPENTPLASVMADPDSWADPSVLASFALASTSTLGVTVSADSVRNGPAELWQKALTLAAASEGRTILMLGAGEAKQLKPFGYRREGLARMEEMFEIFELFSERDEPIDFDGRYWKYEKAWIGKGDRYRPKVWVLGGGPKAIDMAVKYADGFFSMVPGVFTTPDHFAEMVTAVRRRLEDHGRDPEQFGFGFMPMVGLHDDPNFIDLACDNAYVRFLTAIMGRLDHSLWEREDVELIFPRDWHYATKLLPTRMTAEETDAIVGKVSRAMVEKSYFFGSAPDVARQLHPYIEAGATLVGCGDIGTLFLPLEEAGQILDREIELCAALKKL